MFSDEAAILSVGAFGVKLGLPVPRSACATAKLELNVGPSRADSPAARLSGYRKTWTSSRMADGPPREKGESAWGNILLRLPVSKRLVTGPTKF